MKMYSIRLIVLLIAVWVSPLVTFGQFSYGIVGGVANYQGDLAKDLTSLGETHLAIGGNIGYKLNRFFELKGQILLTTLTGDDANYASRINRGFKFRSKVIELTAIMDYSLFGSAERSGTGVFSPRITPVVFMGLGISKIDNNVECLSQACQSGLAVNPFPEKNYKSILFSIPFGAALKYDATPMMSFGLRGGYRYCFSDYLDGVSLEGNPDKNDWYFVAGANIIFYLIPKKGGF